MTVRFRHIALAVALHAILAFFVVVGVQCSDKVEQAQVISGVMINPSQLKSYKPPTPPAPTPPKPKEQDEGPQQIVNDAEVVADQAKEKQKRAEEAQRQLDQQKAEEQRQKDAEQQRQKAEADAKAQELKQQQEAQKLAEEQAAAQKKQQEEAKRKADAEAAAAAEQQRKKDLDEQVRKEAEQRKQAEQQAQAAAAAKQKQAEQALREAERRKRVAELNAQLGAESQNLTAAIQNEWAAQVTDAINHAWARPPNTDQNLKATLLITLAPDGRVNGASISQSSGNVAYDDSLTRAVYRASPLPLPSDPAAFRAKIEICFSPNLRNCQ